jgi:hypothetical protein
MDEGPAAPRDILMNLSGCTLRPEETILNTQESGATIRLIGGADDHSRRQLRLSRCHGL